MSRKPQYDLESLKSNVKREEGNIELFTKEIEKAEKRKAELEKLIQEREEENK